MKTTIYILLISIICLNYYFLPAQNAPISTIGTIETYEDSTMVSVIVTDFTNIGACDLLITYDSTVAKATSIELGPGIGQFFFVTSVDTLGKIYLSWLFFQYGIPGLTLPDSSVFLNISFERVNYGSTAIEFDNSLPDNCLFTDGNYDILNDLPESTYYNGGLLNFKMIDAPYTGAPVIEACQGPSLVEIPVTVSEFSQIGAFTLTIQYTASVFSYQSFTNDSGFPNLEVIESSPGTVVVEGISDAPEGVALANNSVLFTLHFGNQGGSTTLTWLDVGESCKYMGPAPAYEPRNDSPQSSFYINGSFTELPLPAEAGYITSPSGGMVCGGESGVTFSVPPIAFADSYEWTIPEGATIDSGEGTPEIAVSFNDNASSGNVSVYGTNECGNGANSPAYTVTVEMPPSIIIQPVSPDTVYAGNGIASFSVTASGTDLVYQWQEYTGTWTDISNGGVYSGSTTSMLTITNPPVSMNNNFYRCLVSGNCEPSAITDGNAVLSVVLPTGYDTRNLNGDYGNNGLQFKSFPNPFSEKISFAYLPPSRGRVIIEIANIYGEKVAILTKKITSIDDNIITTGTKHLRPGIYTATITFKNEKEIIRNSLKIIARHD